ncbi:MAG TPA: Ig-like domain-containing protein [Thermoanaerobaculia bacterium]|jgi:VCBS repeat-containing protein
MKVLRCRFLTYIILAFITASAQAATLDYRVLIDSDNDVASGCVVNGMAGVDQIFVTRVSTTDTTAAVTGTFRQVCSAGALGPVTDVVTSGWPVGYIPAAGAMLLETRLPYSALGSTAPHNLRLGFVGNQGAASHVALRKADGSNILFPATVSRRRTVGSGGAARVITLDGAGSDWNAIEPLVDGIAASGTPAMRMLKIYGFASPGEGQLYFRFDANVSTTTPFASDDIFARTVGSALNVPAPGVLSNDGDPNGLPLTATPVSAPEHGDVTLNPDGSFTYSPSNPLSTQSDSFQYKASNGSKDSNVAKVTINVATGTNHAPVAANDTVAAVEDTTANVAAPGVLSNDTDVDGDALSAALQTPPSHGTVSLAANGGFTYTPAANYFGPDSFTYIVSDTKASSTATVAITVASVNDDPEVKAATFSVDENSPAGTLVGKVKVTDVDTADAHTFAILGGNTGGAFAINPSTGAITVANGTAINFEVTPQFTLSVRATDNGTPSHSDTAAITIDVNDLNDAPLAVNDGYTTPEDTPLNVVLPGVKANDSDEDAGAVLSVAQLAGPSHGTLALAANGSFLYTPALNYNGPDSFTYTLTDGTLSSVGTVTLNVTPVNDPPSFANLGNVTSDEDAPYSGAWANTLSAGPADEALQTLSFNVTVTTNSALFSVPPAIAPDGTLTFTPTANAVGVANVTAVLVDNGGGANASAPVPFTITINAVNDKPTFANAGDVTVLEDSGSYSSPWANTILAGPADESAQSVSFAVTNNSNMALFATQPAISPAGVLTFLPAADASGLAVITVVLTDTGTPAASSDPVQFTIHITPVNDEPSFTSGGDVTVDEDSGAYSGPWASNIAKGANESAQTVFFTVTGNSKASLFSTPPAIAPDGTLTFTPAPNQNGSSNITVEMHDNGGTDDGGDDTSTPVTFQITLAPVNDAPSFNLPASAPAVDEDNGAATASGFATAISAGPTSDESAQTLTFNLSQVSADPTLTFTTPPAIDPATGNLTYTPAPNAYGTATYSVTLSDSGSNVSPNSNTSAAKTFTITVNPINDAPSFSIGANPAASDEDGGPQTVSGFAGSISQGPNESGQTLTFQVVKTAGTLTFTTPPAIDASGNLTYQAAPDANGTATFNVTLSDNGSSTLPNVNVSGAQPFTITVNAVNDAPTFNMSTSTSSDEDAGAQSVPSFATSILAGPPDESGQSLTFNLSQTAIDPTLSFTTPPAIASNGTLTYQAAANSYGTATFDVTLSDTGSNVSPNSNTSVVKSFTITINAINDAPSFSIGGNPAASDEDGGAQTVSGFAGSISQGAGESGQTLTFNLTPTGTTGTLSFSAGPAIDASGNLTYTATGDTNGTATFSVTLSDNGSNTSPNSNVSGAVSFTITVNPVNDAPTFSMPASASSDEDLGAVTTSSFATSILAGPSDESAQTLTFNLAQTSIASTLSFTSAPAIASDGTLTYEAAANAYGSATYDVTLTDTGSNVPPNSNTSVVKTLTITINPLNDAPSFTLAGNPAASDEDGGPQSVSSFAGSISQGTGETGQTLTFNVAAAGTTGTLAFTTAPAIDPATGALTYEAAPDTNGTATFNVTLSDNGATGGSNSNTSAPQSFTITVNPINDAPTFNLSTSSTAVEDSGAKSVSNFATGMLAGPPDESSQTLTFNLSQTAIDSTLSFSAGPAIAADGTLTYTPAANAYGTATFDVTLSDTGSNTSPNSNTSVVKSFTISVTGINDAPSFTLAGNPAASDEDAGPQSVSNFAGSISQGTGESGQTLTFNVAQTGGTLTFLTAPAIDPATGNLTYQAAANANGTASFNVTLSDDGSNVSPNSNVSGAQSFTITVNAVNDAPSFNLPSATTSSTEDGGAQSVTNFLTGISAGPSDESSQTLTVNVSVTSADPTLTFTSAPAIGTNGTLTYQAAANAYGTANVSVTVSDTGSNVSPNSNISAAQTFTITVDPVNDAPSFNTVTIGSLANEDVGPIDIAYATAISSGPNESGQTLTFNVAQTGSTGTLAFSSAPAVNAATGHLTYTAAANTNGSATFSITLSDDGSNSVPNSNTSAAHTFTITLQPVNDVPSFTIASDPPFAVEGAGAQSVSSFATAISAGGGSDESSQSLTFTVTPTGSTGTLTFSAAPSIASDGTLTYTPTAGTNGTASFSVTLKDGGGTADGGVDTTAAQNFTIAIERGPSVTSSNPGAGSTVPRSQDLTFNFDETVTVESDAFSITCNADTTLLPYAVTTATGVAIVVNPTSDLPAGSCTVVLDKNKVHDADTFDPPDGLSVDYSVTFNTNTPPVADDDTDSARGNVTLVATAAEGVLVGDTDADGHSLTVASAGSPAVAVDGTAAATTTKGGSIVFSTNGAYTYNPPAGLQNTTDTVDYVVSDGFGGTDTGTLTIALGSRYVFVDASNASNGTGTQANPFKTLALKDASANVAANDIVIVKSGTYTTGTTLKSGEQLIGQGISSTITATQGTRTFTILTPGAAPVINPTSSDAITLSSGNTVRGFDIRTTTSGRGVVGNAFGALTLNESSVATNGGAALDLTNGAATITLTTTSSTGSSAQGVNLDTVTGTVTLGNGAIASPAGIGFRVNGGTAAITYGGNITGSGSTAVTIASHTTGNITLSGTITGSANGGIAVTGKTSGIVAFSGAQSLSTGANPGVTLTGNTGGTIAFSGTGLAITTTTGAAFTANTGGTVSVTGTNNTITVSLGGSGLTLNGVTVATGANVTFNNISTNAASTTGVSLTSLGGSGSVLVNGGTISSVTGLSMTTMGTVGTSLSNVTFSGGTTAITGTNFGTLTVSAVSVSAANQFLNLNTGTISGTFSNVNGTSNGGSPGVTLTSVDGSATISAGTLTKGGSPQNLVDISGGSVSLTWQGNLTQGQNGALLNVTNGHSGTLAFSGTLQATNGTGLVFNNADGTYNFTGTTTINGGSANIAISNDSAGTFNFNANTSVTGTATAIPFSFASSSGNVTYSGSLTQAAANRLVSISVQTAGAITFNNATPKTLAGNTSSTGILLSNVDGTVAFTGPTTLSGAATITINTDSAGVINFGSGTSVSNPTGVDFSFDTSSATVTYDGTLSQTNAQRVVSVNKQTGGTITFNGNVSAGTASTGVLLTDADGTIKFLGTNVWSGGDAGVDITTNSAGTFQFSAATSISNPSGTAFTVADSAPASLDYNGTITHNNARLISISNASAGSCGTIRFDGNLAANGATATGIFIDKCNAGSISFNAASKSLTTNGNAAVTITNNGADVDFTGGGLVLTTTSGAAFNLTGTAGAVTVTGSGNKITTATGLGLNVTGGTAIGANGLTFESINVNGDDAAPTNAIKLSSTGSAGGLTVTGTGSGTTGGILQDTSGDAILLSNVAKVSLKNMQITSNKGSGIKGTTVDGLVVDSCSFSANGDDAATDESGINIIGLTGTARAGTNPTKIINSTFNEDYEFEIQIANSSGTLSDFLMSNNSITAAGIDVTGNLVNILATSTANMTVDVQGGTFTGAAPATATALHMDASGGQITATVAGGTYTNNNVAVSTSIASGGKITYDVSGVTATGTRSHALNTFANANSGASGAINGKYRNNIVGSATANSGSAVGNGIRVANEGAAAVKMLISGNTVQQIQSFEGLIFDIGLSGTATAGLTTNATILNNTFTGILANRAIEVNDNQSTPNTPAPTVCVDMSGNSFSSVSGQAGNGEEVRLKQLNGTFNVHQKAPTAGVDSAELDDANGGNSVNQFSLSGTISYNQATCPQP